MRSIICCLALFAVQLAGDPVVRAEGLTFGILGKNAGDQNFVDVAAACDEVARPQGDACVLLGEREAANPRGQALSLTGALSGGRFAAVAVSVVRSDLLAAVVREHASIPVISFDSPFAQQDRPAGVVYVGIDNVGFGRDLAKAAKRLRPQGGTVCMMGDQFDPNLLDRMWGVRQELSCNPDLPVGARLDGKGGWTESERCPWTSGDDSGRAVKQFAVTLETIKPDVFIAVGHWPIVDTGAFRRATEPFRDILVERRCIAVFGVGKVLPEYRDLMQEGLVHGLVSIDFPEMGRLCYKTMRAVMDRRNVPEAIYASNTVWVEGAPQRAPLQSDCR